uniref:hypothetical protein n=1 Tax=Bacillus altitudinis TaxID=293387 RepID=UPI001C92F380
MFNIEKTDDVVFMGMLNWIRCIFVEVCEFEDLVNGNMMREGEELGRRNDNFFGQRVMKFKNFIQI